MTREQAKKNLVACGVAEPTEEQITNYLNQVNGETKKEKDKANEYKEKADKADALQQELDGIKEKDMSDADKANKALEAAQKQIAELTKSNLRSEVKAILNGAGLSEDDYAGFVDGLIADNLENSQARANALVATLTKSNESAVKKHDQETLDDTKKPGADGGVGGKEDEKTEAEKFAEQFGKEAGESAKASESIIGSYLD